jgi:predicted dinucleotide-binding enzyme
LKSLRGLDGKIVIDATNPLFEDWSPLLLGEENSAGEEVQKALPQTLVVKAFNTVFADVMKVIDLTGLRPQVTGFYCGDHRDAKTVVAKLLERLGFEARDVGALSSARWLEAMAHLNIRIAVGLKGGTNAYFTYQALQA